MPVGGPDVSPHRVAKALGPKCSADIDVCWFETGYGDGNFEVGEHSDEET